MNPPNLCLECSSNLLTARWFKDKTLFLVWISADELLGRGHVEMLYVTYSIMKLNLQWNQQNLLNYKVCNWSILRNKNRKRERECRLSISTGRWSRARTTLAFYSTLRHYWTSKPEPIDLFYFFLPLISSYSWNMQLNVFVHLLSISSWWSQSSHRNGTLTTGWWKLEMHVLPHYIKVSDNTMLIFICSDGTISFFSITMSALF